MTELKRDIEALAQEQVLIHLDAQIEYLDVAEHLFEEYDSNISDDETVEVYETANALLGDLYQIVRDRYEEG